MRLDMLNLMDFWGKGKTIETITSNNLVSTRNKLRGRIQKQILLQMIAQNFACIKIRFVLQYDKFLGHFNVSCCIAG